MSRIAFAFDTETTGLIKPSANELSEQPFIIEFYGIKWDTDTGEVLGEIDTFINPHIPIEPIITKITGIDETMLVNAPTFPEIYEDLAELMTGVDIITAHNLPFDRNMLANELLRMDKVLQFPWPRKHICTVRASKHLEGYRLSLTKLHEYLFGKPFEGAHRARIDVQAQMKCFIELIERGEIII